MHAHVNGGLLCGFMGNDCMGGDVTCDVTCDVMCDGEW